MVFAAAKLCRFSAFAFTALAWLTCSLAAFGDEPIQFNRDVRPILADRCYQCHGPDEKNRQAELRLDQSDSAFAARKDGSAIVPDKLDASELWRRVNATDPDERMPPAEARPLTQQQIEILGKWIEQGGKWERHWSLIPPARPSLPAVDPTAEARSAIDAFVLERLSKDGLGPSPAAERTTLLRRVTLDLTGLPPSPEEVEAFLTDTAPDAYERAVDRLLASPRYGERWALPWLEAARYADTSGYQSDGERIMWRWRDWVIEALNANMPFDQFTIEQLAGDLLPNPTLDQRIATGFNRNHRANSEGGIIPEEYAVEYVVDRVETTSTVWMGLTLGCARCHDHKFDPFTQREFFQLYAFFNNVPEKGRAIKIGNSPPYIKTPTRLQAEELAHARACVSAAERTWHELQPGLAAAVDWWEHGAKSADRAHWWPSNGLVWSDWIAMEGDRALGKVDRANARHVIEIQPLKFKGNNPIVAGDFGDFGFFDKFTLSAWINSRSPWDETIISRMTDVPQGDGYQLALVDDKLQFNLVKRWLDDALRVETAEKLPEDRWVHVAATYDGSRLASGVRLYVDGESQKLTVLLDELNQTFATKEPLRVGGGGARDAGFAGLMRDVRVYRGDQSPEDIRVLAVFDRIGEILDLPRDKRSANQQLKLTRYFLEHHAPEHLKAAYQALLESRSALRALEESIPTTMVMEEMQEPRPAQILMRGQYDKPGEGVTPNIPAALPPLPDGGPANRLALARWLVDPAHPLTARVTVNRHWQSLFGTGLVSTVEDFGAQGEWPVQADLLDWLATEFIRTGWDVKRLHRAIVTSGTYRQSSKVTAALRERDPDNRLLARGPRQRLSAEAVRDAALAASGLLVEQLGGPSVKPPQPAGLWKELTGGDDYQPGSGQDHYRRSLYTFWKRTIPPPSLAAFDAPTREFCTVREPRTNTPLQALALLNDTTYVDASRALAQHIISKQTSDEERLKLAFLCCVGREPDAEEQRILLASLKHHLEQGGSDAGKLAAWAAICATIMNLDEFVTKE